MHPIPGSRMSAWHSVHECKLRNGRRWWCPAMCLSAKWIARHSLCFQMWFCSWRLHTARLKISFIQHIWSCIKDSQWFLFHWNACKKNCKVSYKNLEGQLIRYCRQIQDSGKTNGRFLQIIRIYFVCSLKYECVSRFYIIFLTLMCGSVKDVLDWSSRKYNPGTIKQASLSQGI